MTRIEYDLLRAQEPQLKLPPYESLDSWPEAKSKVEAMSREQIYSLRAAKILGVGFEPYDFEQCQTA